MPTKSQRTILIVGGAGFIGSHMIACAQQAGYLPVVLDNLATGQRKAEFIVGDTHDTGLLDKLFATYQFAGVMHFAAYTEVGESVLDPARYYHNNVSGTLNLLRAMLKANVKYFVFSSSAAVYGNPDYLPVDELHKLAPINAYGRGNLMIEQMLEDFAAAYDFKFAALRYFNVAGPHEHHSPETHLIPRLMEVVRGEREAITVFGTDYATPDGTCVRDYIHVEDICSAHLLVMEALWTGVASSIYNIGTGQGYSVKQVIAVVREITGHAVPIIHAERRAGDAAELVADAQAITLDLGWQPRYSNLEMIIENAWLWQQQPMITQ
jgi:UDP-glucose 4-epimerase